MRVCFFRSDKPREGNLAEAFINGVRTHGDEAVVRFLDGTAQVADDCEVACMVGVKSRELFLANWKAGVRTVMLDKGYSRHKTADAVRGWEYWRVAVNGHHPTLNLMKVSRPSDRFDRLGIKLWPWRANGSHILLAGSSAKYHDFYGMRDPSRYGAKIISAIQARTQRGIVYRPKPSWADAVPLAGSRFSQLPETINEALADAWATVTHGSNACFESVVAGVPCIILGDGVAKPISSTDLDEVEDPRLASDAERGQWAANLAYQQWTLSEMFSGEAWATIRGQLYA